MDTPDLRVTLEAPLPAHLAVGRGTALFVCGWCVHPAAAIDSLSFLVDGDAQPTMAHGMPRLDPFRMLHPDLDPYAAAALPRDPASIDDPGLHGYRSGFWGIVRVDRTRTGELELGLRATLAGGGEATARLGRIALVQLEPPMEPAFGDAHSSGEPSVVICMATHNPSPTLLARQLDSIRAQTHLRWRCVISDDCSGSAGAATLARAVGDDSRFTISRSPRRLGFYRNFERALALAPRDADYVALADQDDSWHADKLERLLGALGDAQLVYSDARVVPPDGTVASDTWWTRRRNNHTDLLSLLVANSVTGAAALLRRDLLDDALPFPPDQFAHFHDHWLGLVALARGDIAYVPRSLYDYVQHGDASLGHAGANQMPSLRERLMSRRPLRDRVAMWRLHYFVDVCRLLQFTATLRLRLGDRLTPAKRRALARFERADTSLPPIAALAIRGGRELLGTPETLGAEWMLAYAFAWRRLLGWTARERPQRRLRLDALPPPSLAMAPGVTGQDERLRTVAEKIEPLRVAVDDGAPPRVNLLIPTIDLRHFFGGYIAKFNLARRLAEAGERVRIVTVDPVGPLPHDWQRTLAAYRGLGDVFDRVEVAFGREAATLAISRDDRFIATTWWTAHIADAARRAIGSSARLLYLIQEYEPFTFAMGTYAALAEQSYRFDHAALFSSELLRDYFRRHRIGVFAADPEQGDRRSASFENAITAVAPPTHARLRVSRPRRLLFYARPEGHAARNMFELGALAIAGAVREGAFADGWELHGIGTVRRGRRIALGGRVTLELLPRADQDAYAQRLHEHDVGLALMYTPHPSLVPIEMASAGMLTVTNSFENKTAAALAEISTNLIVAEPSLPGVTQALLQAAAGVDDIERRIAGSDTHWSRDWDESFDDELLAWVRTALRDGR